MKRRILSIFICIVFQSHANVILVNNISNGPGQYGNVPAAITAANVGDTIYISPSAVTYGNFTIDKSLTLVGKGSHADVEWPLQTIIGDITLADNINAINLIGINVNEIKFGANSAFISLSSCNIRTVVRLNNNVTNSLINKCIFLGASFAVNQGKNIEGAPCNGGYGGINNLVIQNNIFNGSILSLSGGNIIQNNLFLTSGYAFESAYSSCIQNNTQNALIRNNIFYGADPSGTVNCIFNKNISYEPGGGTPFTPLGGNNLDNVDPVFNNVPNSAMPFNYSYNYDLQSSSPGINFGTDGTNIGAFGGNSPISTTGEPIGMPVIRKMEVQNMNIPQSGNVNVKVRSTKPREH